MRPLKILIAASLSLLIGLSVGYLLFYKKSPSNTLTLFGNVDVREVDIGFRVAGRVAELYFEEGDFVPMGSPMAILDSSPYDSQVVQAQANLEYAKAALANAKLQLERREQAVGIGGVSEEDRDNALASYEELTANFQAQEAALNVALDNLEYTTAYAPTDGIILSRIREPGSVVNPSDPVFTLSVCSPVWIRAYVSETDLGLIYFGMKADIYTDSGRVYQGKIGFISPVAEFTPKTVETLDLRTDLVYRLRIYTDNPDRYLKQGMPVTVKLHKASSSDVHSH